jgi:medium-chain acyl-[acyl-carrier-protein] hydrolase
MGAALSPWLVGCDAKPGAEISLICLGSAGSGASLFCGWNGLTPSWLRVVGVNLPGREARHREPLLRDCAALAQGTAQALRGLQGPIALFGHSFGALLAFETARRLRDKGDIQQPVRLLVAGRAAPQLHHPYRKTYDLPDPEFIDVLQRYGGTDARILNDPEALRFFLPAIRADLAVNAEYVYTEAPPLRLPITAVRGRQDPVCRFEELQAWQAQTEMPLDMHEWDGAHFFYRQSLHRLLAVFSATLSRCRTPSDEMT